MKVRHKIAGAALGTCALAGATLGAAAPALAAGSYIYTQPGRPAAFASCNDSPANCGQIAGVWPGNGTGTRMLCYTDQGTYNGNYSSPRWFVVNISGRSGKWFIHSSYIYYQTSVPHC